MIGRSISPDHGVQSRKGPHLWLERVPYARRTPPRRREKNRAYVNTNAGDTGQCRPATEHLAFAAAQIELALPGANAANLAKQQQLILGEWVQNAVVLLGDLVKA